MRTYELDGEQFDDLASFARHFSAVVLPGYEWSGNLDAFNDILRGGFGTLEAGFVLRIKNSAAARVALGYPETARWYEELSKTCHPTNQREMIGRMQEARLERGETLFDIIVGIIMDHGRGGIESENGVRLVLE